MIRCTTVGIEPSLLCYEMCVLAYRCGALKAWEREKVRMTREEAIGKINAIKKYLTAGNPIWDVREIDEALNMAIKALEQEPIVRCKDCRLIDADKEERRKMKEKKKMLGAIGQTDIL